MLKNALSTEHNCGLQTYSFHEKIDTYTEQNRTRLFTYFPT